MIYILVISLAVQLLYYGIVFSRLVFHTSNTANTEDDKVTIVICYKNEGNIIDETLPKILEQDFDELILVNDNSTDNTGEKLRKYASVKIKVLTIDHETSGKKNAVHEGIKASKNNVVLLTDADCIPASKKWSRKMGQQTSAFVLGYGPMQKISGIVPMFSRYETYMTALQYLSYALLGLPYMGVGRNLRMDRAIYLFHKNQIKGTHLASGDDDLMVNVLANSLNTSISIEKGSFVYSKPKTTLSAFLQQKSRHISTSPYYKLRHKIMLGLFSTTHILFYASLIFGISLGSFSLSFGIAVLLMKWIFQQAINYGSMKKLEENDMFWKFPFLDVLYFVYLLALPVFYLFNKNKSSWN